MVAATAQHDGKTTFCLGLIHALKKHFQNPVFMKPVGQQHVLIDGKWKVDKDVQLFKEYFDLEGDYDELSPVIFDKGFTRDYLDGKIDIQIHRDQIRKSFESLKSFSDAILIEGTGHCAVGSICDVNNAYVAKELGSDILLISDGGIGSTFDKLVLNIELCHRYGVKVMGVVVNRVIPEKLEMCQTYLAKALQRYDIPLLAAIPYDNKLLAPSMKDFENLFKKKMISGGNHIFDHFNQYSLVATSADRFCHNIQSDQLIITPCAREDIVFCVLKKFWDQNHRDPGNPLKVGFIFTGRKAPRASIIDQLEKCQIPAIYSELSSYEAMKKINSFVAKTQFEDREKIEYAIKHFEDHISFQTILEEMRTTE